MFRDERQKHGALRALLDTTPRLRGLWTEQGPTDAALRLREDNGATLSHGERALFLAACELAGEWNKLEFGDVLRLDAARLAALCTLLVASDAGAAAVETWIAEHAAGLPRCPVCQEERPVAEGGRPCPSCAEQARAQAAGKPCLGSGSPVAYDQEGRRLCPCCRATWPAHPRVPGQVRPLHAPPDLAPQHDLDVGASA